MCHPFIFKIEGKNILFIGGGKVATRKIESLLKSKPNITVISQDFSDKLQDLNDTKAIKTIKKDISKNDISSRFDFVFICTDNHKLNRDLAHRCKAIKIPINVADDPNLCDFYLPAVVEFENFTIAVTTKGKNPSLSKQTKNRIKEILKNVFL
jgi:precorrin-2 dehydrogenase/sirohydrochlorin ferrochelatase